MKIPKIIYNDNLLNKLSWFMQIGGITLWPWIILRERYRDNYYYKTKYASRIINHESIHIKQQQELLIIVFYAWYVLEWGIKILRYGSTYKAYKKISFEQEAKAHEDNLNYIENRKVWAFLKYLFK